MAEANVAMAAKQLRRQLAMSVVSGRGLLLTSLISSRTDANDAALMKNNPTTPVRAKMAKYEL